MHIFYLPKLVNDFQKNIFKVRLLLNCFFIFSLSASKIVVFSPKFMLKIFILESEQPNKLLRINFFYVFHSRFQKSVCHSSLVREGFDSLWPCVPKGTFWMIYTPTLYVLLSISETQSSFRWQSKSLRIHCSLYLL